MRVLAIDPGYDRLGVAVLEKENGKERVLYSDCFETERTDDLSVRLLCVGNEIKRLLREYAPTALGIETLFFNKNQKTAMAVAEARGIIMYLGKEAGCSVYEFGPQEIKVAVTGYGKSDKKAVIDMVKRLIPSVKEDALDDEYDAIAVGITALAHHNR